MVDNETSGLLESISLMKKRIESLEATVAENVSFRRGVRKKILIITAGAGLIMAGTAMAITASGVNLLQFMDFGPANVNIPALDTSVRLSRSDPAGVSAGYTNEVLSLVAEATQTNSFTWPLYVQLSATNSPYATQASSQSDGITVRAFQRSTGSPWLTAYHSELFHGKDNVTGANVLTNGTSILYNAELTSTSSTGSTIGLNIMNTNASTSQGTSAIQIIPGTMGWGNGILFEPGGNGNIGINFDNSHYNMGLDLRNNSLRMSANQRIYLESTGQIYIQYNSSANRVQIVKSGQVVASW